MTILNISQVAKTFSGSTIALQATDLAVAENDFITINFLQWFLTEQLEEVSSMDTLLKIVQRGAANLLSVEEYLARVGIKGAGPA